MVNQINNHHHDDDQELDLQQTNKLKFWDWSQSLEKQWKGQKENSLEVTQESSERQEALALAVLVWLQRGRYCYTISLVKGGGSLRQAYEPVSEKSIERFVWTFDYLCKKKEDWQINK